MEYLKELSATISALAALTALGFSIFIYVRTRKILKRFERPLISLFRHESKAKLIETPPTLNVSIQYLFKNIGKHPAQNLRAKVGACQKDKPQDFSHVFDRSAANRIDMGGVFGLNQNFTQNVQLEGKKYHLQKIELYIYIFVAYEDTFDPEKKYYDEFLLRFVPVEALAYNATLQEKIILAPFISSVYEERKNLVNKRLL